MKNKYSENRINELRKQKEGLQKVIQEAVVTDTIAEELKNIVKGAEESVALNEKRLDSGRGPADMVQDAKEKMMRAKIELARRIEEVRQNAGQGQLADIDGKIAAVTSDISDLSLQENFKMNELHRTREFLAKSDDLELMEMKLDAARRNFVNTLNTREDLKNRLWMQRPLSITVIGMD